MTRARIIAAGVNTLKESYPSVNSENIFTDYVYAAFFKSQLEELAEQMPNMKKVCDGLLAEIETKQSKTL